MVYFIIHFIIIAYTLIKVLNGVFCHDSIEEPSLGSPKSLSVNRSQRNHFDLII